MLMACLFNDDICSYDPLTKLTALFSDVKSKGLGVNIAELNKLVTDYAVPQIYNEAVGYLKYKRDVSTLPTPLRRPTSTFHSNTLELKKFF